MDVERDRRRREIHGLARRQGLRLSPAQQGWVLSLDEPIPPPLESGVAPVPFVSSIRPDGTFELPCGIHSLPVSFRTIRGAARWLEQDGHDHDHRVRA